MSNAQMALSMEEYVCSELPGLLGAVAGGSGGAPNPDWAHRVCKSSRTAHVRVWQERPECTVVKTLTDLLRRLHEAMEHIPRTEDNNVQVYVKNVALRHNSCVNYLQGRPPLFPTQGSEEEKDLLLRLSKLAELGIQSWPPGGPLPEEELPERLPVTDEDAS